MERDVEHLPLRVRTRPPSSRAFAPGPAPVADFLPSTYGRDQSLRLGEDVPALAAGIRFVESIVAGAERFCPVFVRREAPPIPGPGGGEASVRAFDLAWTTEGELALVAVDEARAPIAGARTRGGARTVTILAVALAVAVPPAGASAAPPKAKAAPELATPEAEPGPVPGPESETEPEASRSEPEGPAPDVASPAAESASLYDVLVGEDLRLDMRDGSSFRGKLLAVQSPWLICARAQDGHLVAVLQSEIGQVYADARVEGEAIPLLDEDTGRGRMAAGIAMTVGGAVMTLGGIFGVAYENQFYYGSPVYVGLPMFLPAVVLLGVGIPLWVQGSKMQKKFRAKHEGVLFPGDGAPPQPGRSARRRVQWDGGLRLRF